MRKIRDIDSLTLKPLDARSVALSVLLGSHPPVLPARALVALAELFAIAGGTMRTALSRMVAAGELELSEGRYRLAGRLLDRQRSQDIGRRDPVDSWDGTWHTIIVAPDQRDLSERRRFRGLMSNHRFGELRPDIWMRPANLELPQPAADLIITSSAIAGIDPRALCERLWDLESLRRRADSLDRELTRLAGETDWMDPTSIPEIFTVSAAVVRYLRDDPLLPVALAPPEWPAARLRADYDAIEGAFEQLLHRFLTTSE